MEAAEEAVAIRRELAAISPDVFGPELAVSLAVLANCLEKAHHSEDAVIANEAAIATLSEAFLAHPEALAPRMVPMVVQYLSRCAQMDGRSMMGCCVPC